MTDRDRPMMADTMFHREATERFLRITRPGMGWYIGEWELAKEELSLTLTESEPGEVVSFEVVEMTRAEYEALPEFEGW